jgi:hypothetical protein
MPCPGQADNMHHNQRHYTLSNAICYVTTQFNMREDGPMLKIGDKSAMMNGTRPKA